MKKLYFTLIALLFLSVANAQIVNIPDANFKALLLFANIGTETASNETPYIDINGNLVVNNYNKIDTNNDGQIQVSEALLIKYLNVSLAGISSVIGINEFINLKYFNCDNNQLTSLNVSSLTNLQLLICNNNQLTSVNVSGLTNLQRLECISNQLTSLNVSGLTNLQILECSYNQLTSLNLSGLTNLQILECSYNQLTSLNLSYSTNLVHLICNDNQLSSLNVSGLTNLQYLYCNNNQLPSLNVSGLTNLFNFDCSGNQIQSIDFSGLTNLNSFGCSGNQLSNLNLSALTNLKELNCSSNQLQSLDLSGLTNLLNLNCSFNQLPNLNVSALTNLIRLDCFSNQLPSMDVSGLSNLQYLNCGSNQLPSLNVSGLSNLQYFYCYNNQLPSLNVSGLTNLLDLACFGNQLTSLFIKNNNIVWEYLEFNNNPSLQYICADDNDLTLVQQKITTYGYTNCNTNSYCSFTPGGVFYTIQGSNKIDSNNNGCDGLDTVYPNLKSATTNGSISGSVIANASGNYSVPIQAGVHTITPQLENPNYFTISPTSVTVTFPATTSPFTQNFCIVPTGVKHDLEVVVIPIDVARPGFDATYKIKYKNKGNQSENATVNFTYNDAILDYVSATITPTTQATGTLSWAVGTITPFQSGEILVTLNVNSPMETPAVNGGDILSYTATANGLSTDETPDDNTVVLNQIVVNSFDPNDKTCLEGNVINPSMIGKYVHYKIRFENTGTFAAQNIVVKDIIDTTKFDIASLQMTDASHSCITKISNTNKVEFIFENINLPFDDANNDGYVVFKIKTKPTLTLNSTISNLANIYFDYNFPIVTNTATSTFTTLGNDTFEFDNYFTIYPNPVAEVLSIKAKQDTQILGLSIYTMLGQLVQTVVNPTSTLDVADLKTGTYFVKITTDNGVSSSNFVKE